MTYLRGHHRSLNFWTPLLAAALAAACGPAAAAETRAQGAPGGPERAFLPEEPSHIPGGPEAAIDGMPNTWRYIVIHHSASPSGNAAAFDRLHRRKGWDCVAYHFVINNGKGGADGALEVSPRWSAQKHGAHAGGLVGFGVPGERNDYNEFGIGICLVGNFEKKAPTAKQLKTLADLVRRLRTTFNIPAENVLGHRHVKGTACPGRHFPWAKLYARMDLPAPAHLFRRAQLTTFERCPWCYERDTVASGQPGRSTAVKAPGEELPPAPAAFRGE